MYIGSQNGRVFALGAAKVGDQLTTPASIWKFQTGGRSAQAEVADGVVYVSSWGESMYALDAASGAILWRNQTEDATYFSPLVDDGVVHVGRDRYLYALEGCDRSYPSGATMPSSIRC